MKIYLANAALKGQGYDFEKTIEAAAEHGFAGVQLYVHEGMVSKRGLLDRVARKASENGLSILVHLPDELTRAITAATQRLLQFEWPRRALVHYNPRRPVPEISRVEMGLENGVLGLRPSYFYQWLLKGRQRETFLVFDVPRLFGRPNVSVRAAYAFARQTLEGLRPNDVIHLVDQTRPGPSRRLWCPLRRGRSVMAPLLPGLTAHPGVMVLEFEDLQSALQSKATLERALLQER